VARVIWHRMGDSDYVDLHQRTHPPYGISGPKRLYFPLLTVRFASQRLLRQTHETISLLKVLARTRTHVSRVRLNIDVGLCEDVLDLVNPWLQFSVFKDGGGVLG
jgi:hypothetical protein